MTYKAFVIMSFLEALCEKKLLSPTSGILASGGHSSLLVPLLFLFFVFDELRRFEELAEDWVAVWECIWGGSLIVASLGLLLIRKLSSCRLITYIGSKL